MSSLLSIRKEVLTGSDYWSSITLTTAVVTRKWSNEMSKLFDSERVVMEVLWEEGDLPAGQIAEILSDKIGWNRNTTYTVIKKCIAKGLIRRKEPKFICHAELSRETAQNQETKQLIENMFDGSQSQFLSAFLSGNGIPENEFEELLRLIRDKEN